VVLGTCKKLNPFRGTVTVSDKGQVVIPAALMRELGIEKGSQLFILKRDDNQGFIALKSTAIADAFSKLVNNNPI
jgi:AbrB family looped-hinge helix DNA binding protein